MGNYSDCLKFIFLPFLRPQITNGPECLDDKMNTFHADKKSPRTPINRTLLLCLPLLLCLNSITTTANENEWVYTVQTGDNLWDLSIEHMESINNWRKLQKLNNVTNPKHIPPGTEIRFPLAWLKNRPAPVRVLELAGEVTATSPQTATAILLKPGITLFTGNEIRTGANGNVLLEFLDNSRLLLQKNSHLIFERQSVYSNSGILNARMRLLRGRVETVINPEQKNGTRFEIHTPAAITGVRGTQFRVAMESDQQTGRTEVISGKVAVSGTAGKTIEVPANFGTVVTVGQPPSVPKLLLPAPDLSQLPAHSELFPLMFDWPVVDGAKFYRAQISHATAAGSLLSDEAALTKPQLHAVELPDGDYLIRVRAVDADGLEGFNAEHQFRLVVPIEPPRLMTPLHAVKTGKQPPTFHWETAKNAATYHLQLSTSSDFSAPLIDISNHSGTRLNIEQTLDPGTYYWRVASHTAFGKQSAFSPAQSFSLQSESGFAWMLFFLPLILLL